MSYQFFNGCYAWIAYLIQFEQNLDLTGHYGTAFGKRRFEAMQCMMFEDENREMKEFWCPDMSTEEKWLAAAGNHPAWSLGEPISVRAIQGQKHAQLYSCPCPSAGFRVRRPACAHPAPQNKLSCLLACLHSFVCYALIGWAYAQTTQTDVWYIYHHKKRSTHCTYTALGPVSPSRSYYTRNLCLGCLSASPLQLVLSSLPTSFR